MRHDQILFLRHHTWASVHLLQTAGASTFPGPGAKRGRNCGARGESENTRDRRCRVAAERGPKRAGELFKQMLIPQRGEEKDGQEYCRSRAPPMFICFLGQQDAMGEEVGPFAPDSPRLVPRALGPPADHRPPGRSAAFIRAVRLGLFVAHD